MRSSEDQQNGNLQKETQQKEIQQKTVSGKGKVLRRVGVIAAAAAVLLCAEAVARQCFDSVHFANYYNYELKKMQEDGAEVGMVIGGASQVYHGCDTEILAEELGYENVIAASSAGQASDGTYYMIRDVLDRFTPEYVVVGMSWDRFFPKRLGGLHGGRLLVKDHIPFWDGVEFFLKEAPVGQWFNLSDLYRFGGTVKSLQQLKDNYEARKQVASGDWNIDKTSASYYGKNGFIVFSETAKQGALVAEDLTFDESKIAPLEIKYMKKIADLCRERGVKLIWMTLPSTLAELYSIDNYQYAIDYATKFLEEGTGFPYLNFSLIKNREELFPDTVFSDHIHLADSGAKIFSKIFAEAVNRMRAGEDVSDMFYGSVEEMKADVHRIVGSWLQVTRRRNGTFLASYKSLQNDDIIPEYRLVLQTGEDEDSWEPLNDWTQETSVEFSEGELELGQRVRVQVRPMGSETVEAYWTATVIEQADAGNEEEVFDATE